MMIMSAVSSSEEELDGNYLMFDKKILLHSEVELQKLV